VDTLLSTGRTVREHPVELSHSSSLATVAMLEMSLRNFGFVSNDNYNILYCFKPVEFVHLPASD